MQQLLKRKLDPLLNAYWQEAMLYSQVYIDSSSKVEWITVMMVVCTCLEMDYVSKNLHSCLKRERHIHLEQHEGE